ncbi:ankyrin repeat-containing protein [Anaeramoeba flamelloides]|uniref:Ankyrin repeat-containing protein n=1 Tax=Anaeramoeba flamelloides TaxID=1746091 RepID=A0AAV7Z7N2_9EUKA|nr:ankyrin repeat-containing protein [Anaeramoeba flamelloides]
MEEKFCFLCQDFSVTSQQITEYIQKNPTKNGFSKKYRWDSFVNISKNNNLNEKLLQLVVDYVKCDPTRALIHMCKKATLTDGILKSFLNKKINLDSPNETQNTCLHQLCKNHHIQAQHLRMLIKNGANPNIKNNHGNTSLLELCSNPQVTIDLLKILLQRENEQGKEEIEEKEKEKENENEKGNEKEKENEQENEQQPQKVKENKKLQEKSIKADIKLTNKNGETALIKLCRNAKRINCELITFIVKMGSDPNKKDNKEIPALLRLVHNRTSNEKMYRCLTQLGADEHTLTSKGSTLLIHSCEQVYLLPRHIRFWIEKGSQDLNCMNYLGDNALITHCKNPNCKPENVEALLQLDTNVNQQNEWGFTALIAHCKSNRVNYKVIELLLRYGADPNLQDSKGWCALKTLVQNNGLTLQLLKQLIEGGSQPNLLSFSREFSAFMFLCKNRNVTTEMIQYLLDSGGDITLMSKGGWLPLLYLCQNKFITFELLAFLLKHQKNVNNQDMYGNTALVALCKKSYVPYTLIKLLLDAGAKTNFINNFGHTAIYYLVGVGNKKVDLLKIAYLLIKAGTDVHLFDPKTSNDGVSPLEYVKKSDIKEKKALLQIFNINILALNDDFFDLWSNSLFFDFAINKNNHAFRVHKIMLQLRTKQNYQRVKQVLELQMFSKDDVFSFLNWIYTGNRIKSDLNLNFKNFGLICKKLDLNINLQTNDNNVDNIDSLLKNNLKQDLKKLWIQDSSKDFTIIIENNQIKVHKIILQCRTAFFKKYFDSLDNDNSSSNQYTDVSGFSYESIVIFIKYLYFEEIDKKEINTEIHQELLNCITYYGINPNSDLKFQLMFN